MGSSFAVFFSTVGFPLSASHHQKVEFAVFYPRYYVIFFYPRGKNAEQLFKV